MEGFIIEIYQTLEVLYFLNVALNLRSAAGRNVTW